MRQFSSHKKLQKAENGNMGNYWKEKTKGAKKKIIDSVEESEIIEVDSMLNCENCACEGWGMVKVRVLE